MKTLPLLLLVSSLALSQEYKQGKIDMHGGEYDSLSGYKARSFHNSSINSLLQRDTNSTKKTKSKNSNKQQTTK